MRYALSGSALLHAGLFGTALLGFAWPQPEDAPPPGAVTVDIITMETVSTNPAATLEAMTAQNLVAAGAETVQSQTIEPVEPDTVAPVEAVQAAPAPPSLSPLTPASVSVGAPEASPTVLASTAAALETASLAPLEARPVAETLITPLEPTATPSLEPVSVAEAKQAPIPQTLSFTRPSAPTPRATAPRKPVPPPAQAPGNGGSNNADAAAGKAAAGQQGGAGGGGTADIAPWERQVRRALAGARRYPRAANGASGDVVVRFVVSAAGALSGVSIIASSGNPVLDQAALDTVSRAAPFPPLPAGSGMASKTVQLPLGFVR